MRQVSVFIIEMAKSISDDLRNSVAPDKLQFEVEKELQEQMLAQLVRAIGEYKQAIGWNQEQIPIKRRQVMRYMGYVSEMWTSIDLVKGAIPAEARSALVQDADFEVV